MNYFEILDLRMEPFSNSPDPDFLYRSPGHERCLHQLEIALRLRRGLSVVLGDVGTGKTTLCRELLRTLDEDGAVNARLLLDPGFSSPDELLAALHELFLGTEPAGLSPWQIKERIKNMLFDQGVDGETVTALVIDEGQKLPPHCLEVLRELLNYETNDKKLLQIVVFAQNEFSETLDAMPNLRDRLNDIIRLGPLSFSETKAMVRHRMDRAKAEYVAPELLTTAGYWALWRITGGSPRRIVRLCHKIVLALIVKERKRAGWRMVRVCASDNEMAPRGGGWLPTAAVAIVLLSALAWFGLPRLGYDLPASLPSMSEAVAALTPRDNTEAAPEASAPEPEVTRTVTAAPPAPREQVAKPAPAIPAEQTASAQAEQASAAPAPPARNDEPNVRYAPKRHDADLLGRVSVHRRESLSDLIATIYGRFRVVLLEAVLAANPGLGNPDLVEVGTRISFPVAGIVPAAAHWVQIDEFPTLARAVAARRALSADVSARVLPVVQKDGNRTFALIYGDPCTSAKDAEKLLARADISGAALASGTALLWR